MLSIPPNGPLWLFAEPYATRLKQYLYVIAAMNRMKTIGPIMPATSKPVEEAAPLANMSTDLVGNKVGTSVGHAVENGV